MCFSCILSKLFKGGFVPLHSVWTGIFVPWVKEQPDPSLSPGNVPSPGLPWCGSHAASHFFLFPAIQSENEARTDMKQQHFRSRCAAASVSIFPSCNHTCNRGNNRLLCCSFMAEGMFLNPAAWTLVLHCWAENRGKGVSQRAWGEVCKVDPTEHISVFQMKHQKGVVCNVLVPCEENLFPAQFWANYWHLVSLESISNMFTADKTC